MKTAEIRWRRMRQRRAKARSERLEAALSAPLHDRAADGTFAAERSAARALVRAVPPAHLPPEPLVAVKAVLAAQRAEGRLAPRGRARVSLQMASGLAMVAVTALAVGSSKPDSPVGPPNVVAAEERAVDGLYILNETMEEVRESVAEGDREKTKVTSARAAVALREARKTAALLPPGNPVRDRVLAGALQKISELQSLVTSMRLEVPSLAAPATGTASSEAAGATPTASGPPTSASGTSGPTGSGAAGPASGSGPSTTSVLPGPVPSSVPSALIAGAPTVTSVPAPPATSPTVTAPPVTSPPVVAAPTTTTSTRPPTTTTSTTTTTSPSTTTSSSSTTTTVPAPTTTTVPAPTTTTGPPATVVSPKTATTTTTTSPPAPPPATSTTTMTTRVG